jgi:DNA-binding Lrp family transcriptional regulator
MDDLDRALINAYQGGFPLAKRPFAVVAEKLGISEAEAVARVKRLLASKQLTRFGPLYHAERMGGALTLAALAVPPADFERVAAIVNAMPEIAHNYERAHRYNMWFVVAVETPEERRAVIERIERATDLPVLDLPKEREYFVGMQWQV